MPFDTTGWIVAASAVLLTGISKAGLGGALGGFAVPFMSLWLSPRDAAAVMLPILVLMDVVGIRAWRGQWSGAELRALVPAALTGIALGTLAFGVLSERAVKGAVGMIAVLFALDRLLRRSRPQNAACTPSRSAWLWGAASGFTSTLAHAGGPPLLMYLLNRGLPRTTFVATSVAYFAMINAAKLPFYLGLGLFTHQTLLLSALLAPLVPLGVWLGLRLLRHIPERPFYVGVTALLGLSGLKLIWDALG
ncbi:MAG TPA: sulfite exporter TauE/SafE family protein [Nevskiales bacterium]|nr:sulfite exporter TauE/SafE family protein [Nevskiales bacterium]